MLVLGLTGANLEYSIDEVERQTILLAIARLAVERPGWDHFLGHLAEQLRGREMFEQFKVMKQTERVFPPAFPA